MRNSIRSFISKISINCIYFYFPESETLKIVCNLSGHSVGAASDWDGECVVGYKSEIINANTLHHLSVLLSRKCRI